MCKRAKKGRCGSDSAPPRCERRPENAGGAGGASGGCGTSLSVPRARARRPAKKRHAESDSGEDRGDEDVAHPATAAAKRVCIFSRQFIPMACAYLWPLKKT